MRKNCIAFLVLSFSLYTIVASAQLPIDNKLIPETVKKHFAEKFPTAGVVVWTQPSPGFLETTFSLDKHTVTVMYAMAMGDWISTDTKLKQEEFPKADYDYTVKEFPTGKITQYYKSETKKATTYVSYIKSAGKTYSLSFDMDGNFLSKEEEE